MGAPPSEKVVEAVADLEGREPLRLEPPLFRVIDPDALDALYESAEDDSLTPNPRVTFEYLGYRVIVDTDAEVTVE